MVDSHALCEHGHSDRMTSCNQCSAREIEGMTALPITDDELVEAVARAILEAEGENPDDFHTRASYASGLCLTDHAIPLWRQADYRKKARAAIEASGFLSLKAERDELRLQVERLSK